MPGGNHAGYGGTPINLTPSLVKPMGMPGGGGFGSGGGSGSYVPTPFNSNTQTNPQIDGLLGEMKDYRGKLAGNVDHDATNAMQRQRDLASGQMKEFGAMAGRRGAGPGSGAHALLMRKGMDTSNRNLAGLNADLASDGRKQYANALGQASSTAIGQAGVTLGQQQQGLAQWNSQQSAAQAAAQLKAMQDQNMWNNVMQIFSGFGGH